MGDHEPGAKSDSLVSSKRKARVKEISDNSHMPVDYSESCFMCTVNFSNSLHPVHSLPSETGCTINTITICFQMSNVKCWEQRKHISNKEIHRKSAADVITFDWQHIKRPKSNQTLAPSMRTWVWERGRLSQRHTSPTNSSYSKWTQFSRYGINNVIL